MSPMSLATHELRAQTFCSSLCYPKPPPHGSGLRSLALLFIALAILLLSLSALIRKSDTQRDLLEAYETLSTSPVHRPLPDYERAAYVSRLLLSLTKNSSQVFKERPPGRISPQPSRRGTWGYASGSAAEVRLNSQDLRRAQLLFHEIS